MDYKGDIPVDFEIREFSESYYLVFFHPAFDDLKDNGEVMWRVDNFAWNVDPASKGFE